MTSNGFLLATSAFPAYLGLNTAKTYPNPVSSTPVGGVSANGLAFAFEENPALRTPGSLGNMEYYSYWDSPWKDSQKFELDYGFL